MEWKEWEKEKPQKENIHILCLDDKENYYICRYDGEQIDLYDDLGYILDIEFWTYIPEKPIELKEKIIRRKEKEKKRENIKNLFKDIEKYCIYYDTIEITTNKKTFDIIKKYYIVDEIINDYTLKEQNMIIKKYQLEDYQVTTLKEYENKYI